MRPRTFRAASTQLALEQVQNELGSDAIILSVRQVPVGPAWQTWKRPAVEVLAVSALSGIGNLQNYSPGDNDERLKIHDNQGIATTPALPKTLGEYRSDNQPSAIISNKDLESYLAHLMNRIAQENATGKPSLYSENNENLPAEQSLIGKKVAVPEAVVNIKDHLDRQGLDRELIKKVLTTCCDYLDQTGLRSEERLQDNILRQLTAFTKGPRVELLSKTQSRRILYLIGSSGSGKTSVCAKIAAHYCQRLHKKVSWICADTVRTGAIQLARSYTDSLRLQLHLVYTPDELKHTIEGEDTADLILVDTPACNPYRAQDIVELGEYLTIQSLRETYLTITANMMETEMSEIVAALSPFNLTGLIVTKLDESAYFGSIYNLVWRSQIPVCAFTDGTGVLNNLHPARVTDLAGLIIGMGLKR
jgi:flagellar biosynthesis protein FlhF